MIKLLIHNHNFDSFPFYNLIAGLGFINEYVGKTNELYISLPDKANGERNERNVYNIKYIVY